MPSCSSTSPCKFYLRDRSHGAITHTYFHSQESYEAPDTDPRTGLPLDIGSSDLEGPGSAKKNGGFFQDGLLHALETQHRGAGGIPEVKVVGNGHCHGKAVCSVSTRLGMEVTWYFLIS
jgi:hypothetical protein